MTNDPRCRACQMPLPPTAAVCPRCGLEAPGIAPPKPLPPPRRLSSPSAEMTQIIEMPPGALLPQEPPAAPPLPEKTDRRGIALAVGLGLLAGALVLLLIAGVIRSRQSASSPAAFAHP